jgi:hypothetical protein
MFHLFVYLKLGLDPLPMTVPAIAELRKAAYVPGFSRLRQSMNDSPQIEPTGDERFSRSARVSSARALKPRTEPAPRVGSR